MSDFARILVVKECCWTLGVATAGDLKLCSVTLFSMLSQVEEDVSGSFVCA